MTHVWAVSVLGAAAAVILFLLIPRRRASGMTGQADPGERATLSIIGGGTWFTMWWPISATWPLVRLDLFSWGVRIGPNLPAVAWLLPTTNLRWSEILVVRRTRATLRFTSKVAPNHWVSFGPKVDQRLVEALKQHGVNYQE